MANPEHLAILKKGMEAWNEWREQNPEIRPDLAGASFLPTVLSGTNLSRANLRGVCFSWRNLTRANLSHADLSGADLGWANLTGADLTGADLGDANARYCHFCQSNLTKARLTGAKLYGTARDDWVINGVECRYVFWDFHGEHRTPRDQDLAPGEFERLYRTLPTIEYVFQNRMTPMDPLIMDRVVQTIRQQNPDYDIQIDSISARGLAPSIKFTVQQEKQKEPALAEVTRVYEAKVHELAGRLDEARSFIQRLIDRPNSVHITNARGKYLAIGGSTMNVEENIYYAELRKAIESNETLGQVAKRKALDVVGSAIQDFAKGQVKEAAKQIIELGKDLGPVIVNTAAYAFFRRCL